MPIVRRTAPRSAVPKPSYPIASSAARLALAGAHPKQIDRQVRTAPPRGAGATRPKVNDPRLHALHAGISRENLGRL
jgi:hypothetical protein